MPWIRRKLRDNTVYVQVDSDGKPQAGRDGRVKIRYQPKVSAKVYRAAARNLEPTGDPEDEAPIELAEADAESSAGAGAGAKAGATMPEDAIVIYTDGACTGNPGPAGIGVVLMDGEERRELSEYLGQGTNNIAELVAIERALEIVAEGDRQRPVVVHSDSSYSIGLLSKGWKAKANTELVARIRSLMSGFGDVRFVKVRGHAGVPENERCDQLARDAITNR
ncbi:MAG: hypothetical protein Tsb0020_23160 [Haliangiales bacterium]